MAKNKVWGYYLNFIEVLWIKLIQNQFRWAEVSGLSSVELDKNKKNLDLMSVLGKVRGNEYYNTVSGAWLGHYMNHDPWIDGRNSRLE